MAKAVEYILKYCIAFQHVLLNVPHALVRLSRNVRHAIRDTS